MEELKMTELMAVTETYELLQGYRDKDGVVHVEFEVREMTGADEEAISKPDIKTNGGKVIRTVLERCCVRIGTYVKGEVKSNKWKEIIQELSVGDQDLILMKIREMTLGDEIESQYKCPNPQCKQDIITTVEVSELEVKPFNGLHEIPFELPRGFKDREGKLLRKGKLRHPNGLDREVLDAIMRKNLGQANTLMLSRCIIELEGIKVYDELVRNLSVKDRNYLMKLIGENSFGIDLAVEVECPSCYHSFKASLNATNFLS